jgi:uncharacterized protein YaaN involved in tellurite resistance
MKFDILRTRRGKLSDRISKELSKSEPSLNQILEIIDDYEKNNLDTIEKLRRKKLIEGKRISGALKQTINAHGVITPLLIGSATKRILGSLLTTEPKKKFFLTKIFKKIWKNLLN